ncbi:MAG: TlpA disulfide reductase family protein [Anaerolineales bacterium]
MSNSLTGDFDLVAQFSLPTVNRILGSIHQKGNAVNDGITFLHSFRTHIPQNSGPGFPVGKGGIPIPNPSAVQGIIEVQVSTPTITLVANSSTRVTAHFEIMVHYIADDPASTLPEFVHGELQATFSVLQQAAGNKNSLLTMDIQAANLEVNFIPDAGLPLSAQDLAIITAELKSFLNTGFEPVNASLPKGIDFLRFKTMPGGTPAVALLLSLTSAVLNPNAADGVTNTFLQSNHDFAIALSSEFVLGLLKPMKQQIESTPPQNLSSCGGSAAISSPKFSAQLENTGLIAITITATGTFHWLFGTDALSITILQHLQLSLIEATQTFVLSAPSDPTVTIQGLPFYTVTAENDLKAQFIAQRNAAINQAQVQINNSIQKSLDLSGILKSALKISATTTYQSLQVTADGIILQGSMSMAARPDADVEFGLSLDGNSFDALNSWIPAGTIQQYTWSWYVPTKVYPFGTTKTLVDNQRFVIPFPSGMPHDPSQVCLEISGTQVASSGSGTYPVVADSACSIGSFGPSIPVLIPKWWDKLAVGVLGLPDPASQDPGAAVGLVAHLDAQAAANLQANVAVPTLVYFSDAQVTESLNTLSRTITAIREKESAFSMILILPSGSLERLQIQELAELRSVAAESRVALAFTEDYEGTWAQSLHAEKLPSTHLLSPTGQVVWQQDGTLNAAKLTAAIEAQLVRGNQLIWMPLRSFPAVGALAPDFLFDLAAGENIALRRLQGRRILVNFWTTWSSPSVEQLRRLQRLQDQSTEDDVVIVAVNDGEKPDQAAEFFRKNGFTMHFVPDEYRQIARRYRIRCWPTTVLIDAWGKVTKTQFGLS